MPNETPDVHAMVVGVNSFINLLKKVFPQSTDEDILNKLTELDRSELSRELLTLLVVQMKLKF